MNWILQIDVLFYVLDINFIILLVNVRIFRKKAWELIATIPSYQHVQTYSTCNIDMISRNFYQKLWNWNSFANQFHEISFCTSKINLLNVKMYSHPILIYLEMMNCKSSNYAYFSLFSLFLFFSLQMDVVADFEAVGYCFHLMILTI